MPSNFLTFNRQLKTCNQICIYNTYYNHNAKALENIQRQIWHLKWELVPHNIDDLIQVAEDLDLSEIPFTYEEIDNVVKALLSDKSPNPDGFNNEFLKKWWPIIANDFYALCDSFQ